MGLKLEIGLDRLREPEIALAVAHLIEALSGSKAFLPTTAPRAATRVAAPRETPALPDLSPRERFLDFVENLPERSRQFLDLVRTRKVLKISEAMQALDIRAPKAMGGLTGSIGRWAPLRGVEVPYEATTVDGERAWRWIGGPGTEPDADEDASVEAESRARYLPPVIVTPPVPLAESRRPAEKGKLPFLASPYAVSTDGEGKGEAADAAAGSDAAEPAEPEVAYAQAPEPTPADEPEVAYAQAPEPTPADEPEVAYAAPRTRRKAKEVPAAPAPDRAATEPYRTAPPKAAKAPEAAAAYVANPYRSAGGPSPDLLDALPPRSRQFLTLLYERQILSMADALSALDLARPRSMGGVTEPILRAARDLGLPKPFVGGKDPDGRVWLVPGATAPEGVELD